MGLLRVLLAVSVVMSHIGQKGFFYGFGGPNAVEVFFLISGYYIANVLTDSYKSTKKFYINRALRIYPIYFGVSIVVIISALISKSFAKSLFEYPGRYILLMTILNIIIFGQDIVMFTGVRNNKVVFGDYHNSDFPIYNLLWIKQAWTLGIELLFYLIIPFLKKLGDKLILVLMLFLFTVRFLFYFLGYKNDPWSYRFFPFELPIFLLGYLCFRLNRKLKINPLLKSQKYISIFIYAFIILTYLSFDIFQKLVPNRLLQMILLFIIFYSCSIFQPRNDFDKMLGELSYPIYISHVALVFLVGEFCKKYFQFFLNLDRTVINIIYLFIIFIFAKLILLLYVPIERIRQKVKVKDN